MKGNRRWQFRGVQVRLHFSFLILLAYLCMESWMEAGPLGLASGLGLGGLFVAGAGLQAVVRMGLARAFGLRVESVQLLPVGLAARFKEKSGAWRSLGAAVAGPAACLALSFLFCLLTLEKGPWGPALSWPGLVYEPGEMISWFARANLALACLNLIPAYPLAGADLLEAAASASPWRPGTRGIVTATGMIFSLGMVAGGLLWANPALFMTGALVFFLGESERHRRALVLSWQGLKVADVFVSPAAASLAGETMAVAMSRAVHAGQAWHPVMSADGTLAGLASVEDLIRMAGRSSAGSPVGWALKRGPERRVQASQPLGGVLEQLAEDNLKAVAVYEGHRFVGVLDVEEYLSALSLAALLLSWNAGTAPKAQRLSRKLSALKQRQA